jgi:lysophospholipase L1-like esterase
MNEALRSVAGKMGVNLFDFASKFPADKRYFTDGIHVNEEGAALKAGSFADYVVENQLIPGQQ